MPRGYLRALLACLGVLVLWTSVAVAQGGNLLTNPSFEQGDEFGGPYRAQGGDPFFNFAPGWSGWITFSPRNYDWQNVRADAYPNSRPEPVVSGNFAQNVSRSGGTFTAAAYQEVSNIAEGTALRASVKVYIENGEGTNARARIGIGNNVGGNPLSSAIVWSPFTTTLNQWVTISVDATVRAGSVTVFIFMTQDTPNGPVGPNKVYMDDASLVVTGAGTPTAPQGDGGQANVPAPPTSTPLPPFAQFVSPQGAGSDGRVIHTVQSGDTLAAIAVAYGVPIATIQAQNNLQGGLIFPGQKLLIREGVPATNTPPPTFTAVSVALNVVPTSTPGAGGFTRPTSAPTNTPQSVAAQPTNTPAAPSESLPVNTPQSVAVQPTNTFTPQPSPTPSVTNTPEATAIPDVSPTPSEIPPTPTDAPPAPVASASTTDPLNTSAQVCVLMFEDKNQNRLQNVGEGLLAGGVITLKRGADEIATYQTNGTDEPFCFTDLETGNYTAFASAPEGYGLTTPPSLVVSVQAGANFRLAFGAAEGVAVAIVPTANAQTADNSDERAPQDAGSSPLSGLLGLLVIGFAGLVLVGGAVVAVIARRL